MRPCVRITRWAVANHAPEPSYSRPVLILQRLNRAGAKPLEDTSPHNRFWPEQQLQQVPPMLTVSAQPYRPTRSRLHLNPAT